jgi:hypothetical protein
MACIVSWWMVGGEEEGREGERWGGEWEIKKY